MGSSGYKCSFPHPSTLRLLSFSGSLLLARVFPPPVKRPGVGCRGARPQTAARGKSVAPGPPPKTPKSPRGAPWQGPRDGFFTLFPAQSLLKRQLCYCQLLNHKVMSCGPRNRRVVMLFHAFCAATRAFGGGAFAPPAKKTPPSVLHLAGAHNACRRAVLPGRCKGAAAHAAVRRRGKVQHVPRSVQNCDPGAACQGGGRRRRAPQWLNCSAHELLSTAKNKTLRHLGFPGDPSTQY